MTSPRRIVFWFGVALFILATVVWTLSTPYRPDRVFTAIPCDASFVSVHENLAACWDSISSNRLLRGGMTAAGVKWEEADEPVSAPVIRTWLSRLASKETVLAYVPAMGQRQKSAWVLTSWIGGRCQRLRWQLSWLRSRDLHPMPLPGGQTVWILRNPIGKSNMRVSFILSDGMVMACASEDPAAARWMLETSERYPGRQSAASARQPDRARALLGAARGPHWGWINTGANPAASLDDGMIAFDIDTDAPAEIRAKLTAARPTPSVNAALDPASLAEMKSLLGQSADIVACMPLSWIEPLILRGGESPWHEAVRDVSGLRSAAPDALAVVALLDRSHSGRVRGPFGKTLASLIKGLRVPVAVAGWTAPDRPIQQRGLLAALNDLNRTYSFGLQAESADAAPETLTLIHGTGKNLYRKFEPEERIAGVYSGPWFVMASHAGVLKRMTAERSPTSAGQPEWEALCREPGTSAFLWADAKAVNATLKEALAAATLVVMTQDPDASAEGMETIKNIRKWSDILSAVQTLSMRARTTASGTSVSIRVTSRSESEP